MDPLSALKMVGLPRHGKPGRPILRSEAEREFRRSRFRTCKKLSPGNSDVSAPSAGASSGTASFSNVLGGFVQEVSDKQNAASDAVSGLLGGKNVSLHQTMISMEEASVSFQLMVEVRNRLLDSYQELMRMQV
jgi:flagellar hook-basal body complex protein FliE